jgi:(heptosyl)LPS beta-1,4-glucosyltransferase
MACRSPPVGRCLGLIFAIKAEPQRGQATVKISATIIVRNEEANIAEVCESVAWADEIVIVDSDSTDRTVEIARCYTGRVFNREFRGYKDKHEFADAQTSGDWIFWIDADERVTPELRQSIERLRHADPASLPEGFRIARRTQLLGRWIRHSGWYPDYQMRLYRKAASYWYGVSPHETARVHGRVETLAGELLHDTKRDLSEYHRVLDSYTTLAAEYLDRRGKRVRGFGLMLLPVAAFLRTYIVKQGFRDGVRGLIIGMFTAYGVFLKHAKVWEKARTQGGGSNR